MSGEFNPGQHAPNTSGVFNDWRNYTNEQGDYSMGNRIRFDLKNLPQYRDHVNYDNNMYVSHHVVETWMKYK